MRHEDERRGNALEWLATAFMRGAGFDSAGERLGGRDDKRPDVLSPGFRTDWGEVERTWRWIDPDLRAVIEERCTRKQLRALKLRSHGLNVTEAGRSEGVTHQAVSQRISTARHTLTPNLAGFGTYEGKTRGPEDQAAQGEAADKLIETGPRSPESDPQRVSLMPFYPAQSRVDLYWAMRNCVPFVPDAESIFAQDRHPGVSARRTGRLNSVPIPDRRDDLDLVAAELRIEREQDRRARRGWASPADRLAMMRRWYAKPTAVVIPFPMRPTVALEEAA